MEHPRIYIIGSGAIGKALAVFLTQEKKEVILVRGSIDNQKEVDSTISVRDHNNQVFRQTIKITTFSNLRQLKGIVLITTKTFANAQIAKKIADKGGDFSIVLLQNGLNIEKPFDIFNEVYRCVLFTTSQMVNTREISFKAVTASPIGSIKEENKLLNQIVDCITTEQFAFRAEIDIKRYVWNKAIINCAFNSICPLLEIDNGVFYRDPEVAGIAKIIIRECVNLSRYFGMSLNEVDIEESLLLISKRAEGQLISTYEDIRKKRRTEIESLNLEMFRLAQSIDKPEMVPFTRALGMMVLAKSELYLS